MKNSMKILCLFCFCRFFLATLSKETAPTLSAAVLMEARQVFLRMYFQKMEQNILNRKSTPLNLKCKTDKAT